MNKLCNCWYLTNNHQEIHKTTWIDILAVTVLTGKQDERWSPTHERQTPDLMGTGPVTQDPEVLIVAMERVTVLFDRWVCPPDTGYIHGTNNRLTDPPRTSHQVKTLGIHIENICNAYKGSVRLKEKKVATGHHYVNTVTIKHGTFLGNFLKVRFWSDKDWSDQ